MTADCPLTDEQKAIFDAIEKGKPEDALKLVENGVDMNCFDATGMPVLSAAAYKGFHDLVEACLFKGADVNRKAEGHGYTPLMFAALSGKPDVCKLLLDHGAKSYVTNKIGETACELAAFVGMHECVSIINNYIEMDEVDRLLNTKVDGEVLEKYPGDLIVFIHDLCKTHQVLKDMLPLSEKQSISWPVWEHFVQVRMFVRCPFYGLAWPLLSPWEEVKGTRSRTKITRLSNLPLLS